MSNTSRVRGRNRELAYVKHLQEQGWWAQRVDCETDIVAAKDGDLWFLQVKSTVTPWAHFGPKERQLFLQACDLAGARAALIWWPKGCGISKAQWIVKSEFPGMSGDAP